MRPSFTSRFISSILKWTNFKLRVEKWTEKPIKRSEKAFLPPSVAKAFTTHTQAVANKTVATFENKQAASQTHIIYLHGGAYLFEASRGHWDFTQKIVKKSHCRMTLIDYPLAPEHSYVETYAMVEEAYDLLCEQYPDDDFVLMGDSAGAGLAFGLSQKLIKKNHPKLPVRNILLSPWLDLTMSNPDIQKFVKTDHILTLPMLQNAASIYAAGDDQTHYLLSPINGEFADLAPTMVFYSNVELLYPDCIKLKVLASAENVNFQFKEYHKVMHAWVAFPIPERAQVVDDICAFLAD